MLRVGNRELFGFSAIGNNFTENMFLTARYSKEMLCLIDRRGEV